MEAAFLIEISAPGAKRRGGAEPTVDADLVGFEPSGVRTWETTAASGRHIALTVWRGRRADRDPWSERASLGITAAAGHVRRRGRGWSDPSRWAAELWDLGADPPASVLHDELSGIFAAVSVTSEGSGWLCADALGFRCLYRAGGDERFIVSTRAALAAAAHAAPGPPRRNLRATVGLAATSYHLGTSSGFDGVEVLAPGTSLHLHGGAATWRTAPSPYAALLPHRPVQELAVELVEEVSESLRAALDLHAARHILQLTGGRDSRLVLAVAVHAGIEHEFEYETIGPPDLRDVQVAEQLCAALGLRHQTRFVGMRPPEPFDVRVRTFTERSAGMVNAWDSSSPSYEDELRITGVCGESLRSFFSAAPTGDGELDLSQVIPRRHVSRGGLLRAEVADELYADLTARIGSEPPGARAFDRLNAHYLGHRLRFSRLGPREELSGETIRFQPLCSANAIRLGRSLPDADRRAGLLFAEVMRSASDLLARLPFASGGWDARVTDHLDAQPPGPALPDVAGPSAPPPTPSSPAVANGPDQSLVQRIFAESGDERLGFVTAAVADAAPTCWDTFDRVAMASAIDRWGEVTLPDRRALFGAATSLVWQRGREPH